MHLFQIGFCVFKFFFEPQDLQQLPKVFYKDLFFSLSDNVVSKLFVLRQCETWKICFDAHRFVPPLGRN